MLIENLIKKENKSKKVALTQQRLIMTVVLVLVANLILSGVVVGVGLSTFDKWGPLFREKIMGQKVEEVKEAERVEGGRKGEIVQEEENKENETKIQPTPVKEPSVAEVVEKVSGAVVSVIVSKDVPQYEQYYEEYSPFGNGFFDDFFGDSFNFQVPKYRQKGTERKEVGGGTGFAVTSDGLIVTNKHVVADEEAYYSVLMNDETKYEAQVLARDPINDVAILKIDQKNLPVIELGDSDKLKVGEAVIAIGNALGEYRNTVSTGIISGLKRDISAAGPYGQVEQLSGVIQTDAAINPGNSGGPLLNMRGQAIGVNVAIVQGSQNIGFALPINDIKKVVESVKKYGKIVRPWIGVRYLMINEVIKEKNQLAYNYGVLVIRGESAEELAVMPGSPADKAGIMENDIILEVNGKRLEGDYSLSKAILEYNVGDSVELKVYHKGEEKIVGVVLEERK